MILFWGKVRHGDKRGKSLGYPTANTALHKKIEEGVYVSLVYSSLFIVYGRGKQWLPALTFIGSAKTFHKTRYQAETYILNFSKNIYDIYITVKLLKKLRGNKKFASVNELIEQMEKDESAARNFFGNLS